MRRSERKNNPAEFRALLLASRAELPPRRPVKFDMLAQVGNLPNEDEAMLVHDEFVSMKLTTLERETLNSIDAALLRLEAGEFGICLECSEPISSKRLKAIPWANRCIGCEEERSANPHPSGLGRRAA